MKQLLHHLLITVLIIGSSFQSVFAQQMPPIPVDPNVRIGKLDNGLTYYIRKNDLPENRADFYLAMKAGSILEEPEQRGLAHFLEHMSFNGTRHFPGDGLKQYLETIGVRFGYNLNAGTGIESTVYNISDVPLVREGVVDSCLLILRDWSNDLLLDKKEIDKERGVITEEWRSRMSAMQRLQQKALPQMYPGNKYADCLPIGNMDVINNFKPQALRDYYEKWYRPDLQAVVVVGGIDVDAVEQKIKTLFSDIPAQPDAPERIYYPVDDNQEPIIVIEQDKEQPYVQVILFNKHEAVPDAQKGDMGYLVLNYVKNMASHMINMRINELLQNAEPPFVYGGTFNDIFFAAKTKESFSGVAVCKEGEIESGFATLYREIERARRFGFTESEYNRVRAEYLRNLESAYNEREKVKNDNYVSQYVSNYLDNEPIPGIEYMYTQLNQIAPNIPVMAVNQLLPMLVTGQNKVVLVFGPEKEEIIYPSKETILRIIKEIDAEELTAYEDVVSDEPLMGEMPLPGKVVSETKDELFGTTVWTLSNGAKVIIKQTDFKADEIRMRGISLGGTSLFPDSEIANFKNINSVASVGGLGSFSQVELEKALAGKRAWVNASVSDRTETVTGSCSPKDFETMMQLAWLTFTSPRKDEDAFSSFINRTKAMLQNQELEPMVAFFDSIDSAVYMNHPRVRRMKPDMVDQIDYDKILSMYRERYMDAGDFTFIFVGNIDPDEAKPLVEQYLASLPSTGRKETFVDNQINVRKGVYKNEFIREQETPKASILVLYSGDCEYTFENKIKMSMIDQVLDLVYTEKVREEAGGTYGVHVGGEVSKYPKEDFVLQIMFETDPDKKEMLMKIIYDEVRQLMENGPSEVNLNKVKEHMLKKHREDLKENSYWQGVIEEYTLTDVNVMKNYESIVNNITMKDIQAFASKLFGQNNVLEVSMVSPEKK